VPADLATADGIAAVAKALGNVVSVSGIVHGAGSLVSLEPYAATDWSDLTEHFRLHVGAPLALYQAVAAQAAIGRMVFIDSYSASTPRDGWAAYSIVKAAAQMAARAAEVELADTATIRVFPGAVSTPILDAVLSSQAPAAATYAAMVQRGEVAAPAEVAAFIVGILIDAPDESLAAQDSWDFTDRADREAVAALVSR
jgi:NAD(P)-dependent dehydrogenase (short-subunit alcohol dehydrogenase family)